MSPTMLRYIQETYCIKFGSCSLRSHSCIRLIEELHPLCLKCKYLKLEPRGSR